MYTETTITSTRLNRLSNSVITSDCTTDTARPEYFCRWVTSTWCRSRSPGPLTLNLTGLELLIQRWMSDSLRSAGVTPCESARNWSLTRFATDCVSRATTVPAITLRPPMATAKKT